MTVIFLFLAFLIQEPVPSSDSQQGRHLLERMYQQILDSDAHSYQLEFFERAIDRQTRHGKMKIIVSANRPLKVRAEVLFPDKGPLIEYDASQNKHEALLTPKKWFPYVNFHADIHGSTLRQGHHAISETSLHYFARLIRECESAGDQTSGRRMNIEYSGMHKVNGKSCHLVELINPDFHIRTYEVKAGENLIAIGEKFNISPFKIVELNPNISTYEDVQRGQRIQIPSSYARRCQIYLSADNHLPYRIDVYDEKGRFEQYIFTEINLNYQPGAGD